MLSSRLIRLAILVFALATGSLAQTSTQPSALGRTAIAVDDTFLQKEFGTEFKLETKYPALVADFDGDGVADIAIAARAKNPMVDESEHDYKVLDPYYGFYGTGDPKITTSFGSDDPEQKGLVVCIIHGSGTAAWHADQPKAKFVIVNLPFKQVTVKRIQIKKKKVNAIYAEESSAVQESSVIFFDGKKYKYQPMGTDLH